MKERKYDSTVARIAGNIASGFVSKMSLNEDSDFDAPRTKTEKALANADVRLARAIMAETERTESSAVAPQEEKP